MPPINQLLHAATALLSDSESPQLDAEVLLAHVLEKNRSFLHTWPEEIVNPDMQHHFERLINERQQGKPIAYLTEKKEFWSLTLSVSEDSLIPRPDTELLVEQALSLIPKDRPCTVADLGTGCGAIALAIASERPHCHLLATDNSLANIQLAQNNATQLRLNNIHFMKSNWCTSLIPDSFDFIVSNPPYIAADDPHLLKGDVRFEPRQALVAGTDGLDDIRQIILQAKNRLKPGGWLLLEHGYQQADAVQNLFIDNAYAETRTYHDMANNPRVSLAQIPPV